MLMNKSVANEHAVQRVIPEANTSACALQYSFNGPFPQMLPPAPPSPKNRPKAMPSGLTNPQPGF
jgi:hypothetical protein